LNRRSDAPYAAARGGHRRRALRIVVARAGGATASERTLRRDGTPHDLGLFTSTLNLDLWSTLTAVRPGAAAMAALDPGDEDGEPGTIVTTASIASTATSCGSTAPSASTPSRRADAGAGGSVRSSDGRRAGSPHQRPVAA
jgi:hypothetical protein